MLDPRIEVIRKEYDLDKVDFWELPQKKGTWIIKHSALELVAAKAGINFDMPLVLEANGLEGVAAVCVRGVWKERAVWSIGESSPKNCKNAYPWAIAEKRAVDRVILKLIGIHGVAYSEDEADDFKPPPANATKPPKEQFQDGDGQLANTVANIKLQLSNCTSMEEIQQVSELRGDEIARIRKHDLKAFNELRLFKEQRILAIIEENK